MWESVHLYVQTSVPHPITVKNVRPTRLCNMASVNAKTIGQVVRATYTRENVISCVLAAEDPPHLTALTALQMP